VNGIVRNSWSVLGTMVLATFVMTGPSVAFGTKKIKADQAAHLLDEICGSSLPTFKSAPKKAAAMGFTESILETATQYRAESESLAALVNVNTQADGTKYCEIRYRSNENAPNYYRRLESVYDLTTLRTTGEDPEYRNTSAILKVFQGTVHSGPIWLSIGVEVPK
jgi:hypothetical protein